MKSTAKVVKVPVAGTTKVPKKNSPTGLTPFRARTQSGSKPGV